MLAEKLDIWGQFLIFLGVCVTAFFGYLSTKHSKKSSLHAEEANRAVNQRPPGEPTLYALARDTRDQLIEVKLEVKDMKPRIERLEQYSCRDPRFHGGTTDNTSSDNHKDG